MRDSHCYTLVASDPLLRFLPIRSNAELSEAEIIKSSNSKKFIRRINQKQSFKMTRLNTIFQSRRRLFAIEYNGPGYRFATVCG